MRYSERKLFSLIWVKHDSKKTGFTSVKFALQKLKLKDMEYKVTVTSNEGKRRTLNENSGYGMIPISRGNFWELLADLDKGKIKSFSVSLKK